MSTSELSATYTAQAEKARLLATKIASQLKATTDLRLTQVDATNSNLHAQATAEYATHNATKIAIDIQATEASQILKTQLATALTWPIILSDTFVNEANGWPSGEAADEFGISKWMFSNNQLIWEASAKESFIWWAVPNAPQTSDFYLKVAAQQTQGSEASAFGLIFRLLDEENYYIFEITPAGQYSLYQHGATGWSAILPWSTSSAILTNAPNDLSILAINNVFSFFVNSEFLASYANNALSQGQNGLFVSLFNPASQATWEFSDFELRAPTTSLLEITPTVLPTESPLVEDTKIP